MITPSRYYQAHDKPPFCMGVGKVRALPGPVLVQLMTQLDLTESANRSTLHRMVGLGSLAVERLGRVGRYRLAGRLLQDFTRIRSGGAPEAWDGRFHTLLYDIPESQRRRRERFRASAIRSGYRPLRPGVLVSPRDRSHQLQESIRALGVVCAHLDTDAEQARTIARRAWDLERLRELGLQLAEQLATALSRDLRSLDGLEAFRSLHRLVRPVIAWSVEVGDLPGELMTASWPGSIVAHRLHEAHAELLPRASDHVTGLIRTSPHAHLVEMEDHN